MQIITNRNGQSFLQSTLNMPYTNLNRSSVLERQIYLKTTTNSYESDKTQLKVMISNSLVKKMFSSILFL